MWTTPGPPGADRGTTLARNPELNSTAVVEAQPFGKFLLEFSMQQRGSVVQPGATCRQSVLQDALCCGEHFGVDAEPGMVVGGQHDDGVLVGKGSGVVLGAGEGLSVRIAAVLHPSSNGC